MDSNNPHTAPYGSWKSPITSDLIVAETIALGEIRLDGDDIYWLEQRPLEAGRYVVVRRTPAGATTEITPRGFNARTRVHEYGGGAYLVHQGTVYFANYDDQRLYRQDLVQHQPNLKATSQETALNSSVPAVSDSKSSSDAALGAAPRPLTPAVDLRYADGVIDPTRGRMIAVREDHTVEGREAVNTIVAVNLQGDPAGGQVLVHGSDFYSYPRLSPDGRRLAWLQWNHPNMPWDGTELWVGDLNADGTLGERERVAGGMEESIFQPEWSARGDLYFISDRTGWWNLYRWHERRIEPMHAMNAEFGAPQWNFAQSTYALLADETGDPAERILCTYGDEQGAHLAYLDPATHALTPIETPYTSISGLRAARGMAVFMGGSPTRPSSIVLYDLRGRQLSELRHSTEITLDPGYLSVPQPIEFPTENGLTAHAYYYAPQNRDHQAPVGEKPPLIVISHGGPTSSTSTTFALGVQFWTSRGFAVVDVNYGGSTGYGRAYRQRLNGQWGVVDVNDCANAARYLARQGLVDPNRMAIRGGSAGGYTTIMALTFTDVFKAGASHFGISDLDVFVGTTHKFESRYLDRLVGPFPEKKDVYYQRSAIHFTDRLSSPMILFQGLEDKIVPPSQAELMVEALRAKKLPVAYLAFEGEQHGFRRAENIKRALDAELYFYGKVFGFEPADKIEPVEIENLPERRALGLS